MSELGELPKPKTLSPEQFDYWSKQADYWREQASFALTAFEYAEGMRNHALAMLGMESYTEAVRSTQDKPDGAA